ncbi:beta-ketoacyl [acyl carrier protein] synthase domain-containing protein [Streptomyces sp. NPDC000941]
MRAYIESLEKLSRTQLMLLLARQHQAETEGLAVVGMSCRLPGGIDTPADLWAMVDEGRVLATEQTGVPTDSLGRPRWNLAAPDIAPYAAALRQGGYLTDIDLFDAERFGMSEEEARCLDPQQRLLLTETSRALEDAGLTDPGGLCVGVFVSVTTPEYGLAGIRNGVTADRMSAPMATGTVVSGAAGRISVGLGLNGPALTVDTACSSTLVAVHLAGAALRRKECDVAIVGVSHLLLSPVTTAVFAKAGMLSATGRCRPFTARADGYVRAEGSVVLVLKREQDARADEDTPYALIRSSAIHQHGRRATMSAASSAGQQRAIRDCLTAAGVDAAQVGYVEAHGSADKVADAVEIDAIATAYERDSTDHPPLYVGSGKANIGYLETASGAVGLVRAILALRHRTVPAQPDFTDPDPAVFSRPTSVTVPAKALPWPSEEHRLAGVNAFGFTGVNAHVLIEAAATARPGPPPGPLPGSAPKAGGHHWLDSYTWH